MGLITTAGNYCYVQCDSRNCNRKMEHLDPKPLKELARLCGWQNQGDRWICPACAEEAAPGKRPMARERPLREESKT